MDDCIKFVFFGTPEFAVGVLRALEQRDRTPLAVVCQPDRPKGRGRKTVSPPAKLWAQKRSIPVLQPRNQKDPDYILSLSSLDADLAVVAAYGQILPASLLNIPPMGFINVHPSLIPKYRGAAPIQWTLINGDEQTGVSILQVTPGLDDGDILQQQSVMIEPDETAPELAQRLAEIGGHLCSRVITGFEVNKGPVDGTVQNETLVSWAPQLDKSHGNIDWTQPAHKIHNLVRGVQPWPGAKTKFRTKLLKIHRSKIIGHVPTASDVAGKIIEAKGDSLLVQTGDGILALVEVQAAGKKKMPVRAFLSGQKIEPGEILG